MIRFMETLPDFGIKNLDIQKKYFLRKEKHVSCWEASGEYI